MTNRHRTIAIIIGAAAAYLMITATFITYAAAQTAVEGNPDCADLGIEGIQFKDDPPTLHLFDNGTIRIAYFDAFTVSGVLNLRPHDFDLEAIIVKGGPAATVATAVPADGLTAPLLDNGGVPAISHVTVCLSPKEPTTTTTTQPEKPTTTTTTEVPPSTTLPPTTTTSPVSTTPSTTLPSTTTSVPSSTTSSSTTTVPTSTSTTPTPDTTQPPSTTNPPTEITEQSQELPATGIGTTETAIAGALLMLSGLAALAVDRRRGGSWSK